jgi:hypothetical protein
MEGEYWSGDPSTSLGLKLRDWTGHWFKFNITWFDVCMNL